MDYYNYYLKKYQRLINEIGIPNLLSLPSSVKEELKNTTDLLKKVKLLENAKNYL